MPQAAGVGGFGDEPAARTPQSAVVINAAAMADAGATQISQLSRFDASVSDAYNAEGYWSFLTIRGYVADNQYNYRRDGLPINAETALPLGNKQRVEVLKGTSGIQAGTSSPGGLVNLVVKRPDVILRSASIGLRQGGGTSVSVDVSERFGPQASLGLRVNALSEELKPQTRSADGERRLLAVAADWRIAAQTLVEAEVEVSHQSQPSVPGFSMLGNVVPDARTIDPRINLNNQPWSLPVVLDGQTASLRMTQGLSNGWSLVAHAASQQLKSDDRIAFPSGCSAENNFTRYCSDGSFDFYDFRSEGERRRTDALDVSLKGAVSTGALSHEVVAGVLKSHHRARFNDQTFRFAGVGQIDGSVVVPAAAATNDGNTNRNERSTEFYLRDKVELATGSSLWFGLRHSRITRETSRTERDETTSYSQSFNTPWLALSHEFAPQQLVYASWGEGIESRVVPNRAQYVDAGQALAPVKSRQAEIGLKGRGDMLAWSATAFTIRNPQVTTTGACDPTIGTPNCIVGIDGTERHRGLELTADTNAGAWSTHASAMLLQARRVGSSDPSLNRLRPTNVPARALRLDSTYNVETLPGLQLQAALVHEGNRIVLPDNSAQIPAWTRIDLASRYTQTIAAGKLTWRFALDNATNRRAWHESPYQFSHAYLFPMAPRTWRLSLQADL
ncbi:MAG: TonB-dependent siderophore receptor [Burkholderiales bacterium]|nr:TonB-dependent siderophore receptor [Burkholderiales bacterium]